MLNALRRHLAFHQPQRTQDGAQAVRVETAAETTGWSGGGSVSGGKHRIQDSLVDRLNGGQVHRVQQFVVQQGQAAPGTRDLRQVFRIGGAEGEEDVTRTVSPRRAAPRDA